MAMRFSVLLIITLFIYVDGFSQKVSQTGMNFTIRDSLLYVIQKSPIVDANFKMTTAKLQRQMSLSSSKMGSIRDSLFWFTREFEMGVLAGKSKSIIDANIVRLAKKKIPGDGQKAVMERLKIYFPKE